MGGFQVTSEMVSDTLTTSTISTIPGAVYRILNKNT